MAEKEKPYASAMITFLKRDTQEEKAITYPITRIALQEITATGVVVVRKFVAVADGRRVRWREEPGENDDLIKQIVERFDRLAGEHLSEPVDPSKVTRHGFGFADLLAMIGKREVLLHLATMQSDEAFMVGMGILFDKFEKELVSLQAALQGEGHA